MLVLKIKRTNGFRAETFMSMVRWRLINQTGAEHTFGYMTKSGRIALKLEKSHVNDAFVIAGGTDQGRTGQLLIRQVRKCNRKLFKGSRSHLVNTAPRLVHGFQRFDKVSFQRQECFVFGRRMTGRFDLRDISGKRINANAPARKLRLLERARTHQTARFFPLV